MKASERREEIKKTLVREGGPVSASSLARDLGVSRQVIVGDIALLRAEGEDIVATTRGYIIPSLLYQGRYVGRLACRHTPHEVKDELMIIVDGGGEVVDVCVEHHLYGQLVVQLNLTSCQDVENFSYEVEKAHVHLLCELTGGVHLHTIVSKSRQDFEQISQNLARSGYLYRDKDTE